MKPSSTLRDVIGLGDATPRLADATLLMIDYQNTYRTGVMALDGAGPAVAAGARLLAAARAEGAKVVHIVNDGGEGSPYDVRAEIGRIDSEVAPVDGEPVIVKRFPDAFHLTALRQTLEDLGAGPDLVLAGFMTHMCVAATAQGGFEAGFRPTVVAEATATRSLPVPGGGVVSAEALQAASLALIGDLFGTVVDTVDRLTP